ncbi:TldD/PmbA family protein [uncultured Faecalibaculum sp.]|uniref:TldD/PmbA family protein n=1 Tax=uncultured Faecalibaculum sp. TaxID=1729681 RepID=UPI0025DF846B|nr:metallopeptidase TldD-related protein [uncultured Faecalibaculum sp.]
MNKQKWLDRALEKGFEAAEIYESSSRSKEITWFEQAMDKMELSQTDSASIRVLDGGSLANTGLEKLDDAIMDEVLDGLRQQAATITSEDRTQFVPPMETELAVKDKQWTVPETAQVKELLADLEARILAYDERIFQVTNLAWSQSEGTRSISNTLGLATGDEDYVQYVMAGAAGRQEDRIQDWYLIKVVPDIAAFDRGAFVKELCDEVLSRLDATSIPGRTCPVILHREAMTSLLGAFAGLFSGDLISKGISPLKDRLGEKIFSDKITIVDDPRNLDALTIANFDDEGYPTGRKLVVDHGVFRTILHNQQSAARMGTESTGNGFKGGYASPVGVSPMNLYIEPGEESLRQLEKRMQDGLVITDLEGLHAGIDFVSTNFSLQARGYLVQGGRRTQSVTLITAAGSFMELMNDVIAVGSDLDWSYRQLAAPSVLFGKLAISGQ